jgi:pimeloyl-ACP methyl ester carboxylesterase
MLLVTPAVRGADADPAPGGDDRVRCKPAPDGSITTWLVSPPFEPDREAGFARDLLPAKRGETSNVARSEGGGGVAWRGMASSMSFVELTDRCRKRGESVFYAACELRPHATGQFVLSTSYWPEIAVWLDGVPVLYQKGEAVLGIPRAAAGVRLKKGATHHVLVKIGSKSRQSFFQLRLTGGTKEEPKPAPVDVLLRMPRERLGELLVDSMTLAIEGGTLIGAGRPVRMRIRVPAGSVATPDEVELRTKITDSDAQLVRKFRPAKQDVLDLVGRGLALPWRLPETARKPYYKVTTTVVRDGKTLGELSETLYLAEGLSAWADALSKQITAVRGEMGRLREYTDPDYALALLKLEKAGLGARAARPPREMAAELAAAEAALSRIEKHQSRKLTPGLHEFAHLSSIDDSPQPYYIFVPKKHDGRTKLPCVLYLHGYNPDLNKLNWQLIPTELLDYCDQFGYYLVAPFARSNTDFQGVGEKDVRWVYQLCLRRLPIDPQRVFLVGYSMGAMGAFTLGAHYPDHWAGIVSVSGRADYYLWKDLDRSKVEPYKRRLIDAEFGAQMIGNYKNLPVLMYHGGADTLIRVEQSRTLHNKLKAMGADTTYKEFADRDHWIFSDAMADDGAFRWMAKRKLDLFPKQVDYASYTIKYHRAYWADVLDLVAWGPPIRVKARLVPGGDRLDVFTENVATLRLNLAKELVDDRTKLTVRLNGKDQVVKVPGVQTFEVAKTNRVGPLRKSPRLCGPVKDAFNSRFIVVVGVADESQAETERFRQRVQRAASEWYRFTKAYPLIQADRHLSANDIKRANLMLIGSPANNTTLRKIAPKLPIKVDDKGFSLLGKTYPAGDHGLVMIYPNPLNPTRYVVVRSGQPYGGRLSENHKYDLLPDFVIFRKGTDYDDTDQAVVAGHFDENWQLAERLIWRRGKEAPDPRRNPPPPLPDFDAPPPE